jgi:hypothetical protein
VSHFLKWHCDVMLLLTEREISYLSRESSNSSGMSTFLTLVGEGKINNEAKGGK